jgi:heat shock protein HslJ
MATSKAAGIVLLMLLCAQHRSARAAETPIVDCLPDESCGARGVTHDLEGTRWVLVRLGGVAVGPAADQREPFIALESKAQQVVGFAGCNRFFGAYTLTGDRLGFGNLANTLMACPDMHIEDGLLKALGATARWRIGGAHLELLDATGRVQARFEARDL